MNLTFVLRDATLRYGALDGGGRMTGTVDGIDDVLTTTRSARRTLDLGADVDRDEIRDCLRIALQAPNGTNQQAWRWVVVFDADLRRELASHYRDAYLSMTGGMLGDSLAGGTEFERVMRSTEWLVDHLAEVPVHVIPCVEPYLPRFEGDESFQRATLYGSIFPAVWNLQLALHTRGYGSCLTTMHLLRDGDVGELLGIPGSFVQAGLLPVARLLPGTRFGPAPRRPVEELVTVDGWDGAAL
jgi:nitroreductase